MTDQFADDVVRVVPVDVQTELLRYVKERAREARYDGDVQKTP